MAGNFQVQPFESGVYHQRDDQKRQDEADNCFNPEGCNISGKGILNIVSSAFRCGRIAEASQASAKR